MNTRSLAYYQYEALYRYDDSGTRIRKKSTMGEVLYVNQNYVLRNNTAESINVYAGTTRIATRMNIKNADGSTTPAGTYYYHADHLGSSSTITDSTGTFSEHMEYFPYGETWIHENTGTYATPYKFTAKEQDSETGLYYYGARYMDPKLGRFVSVDPILSDYLPENTKISKNEDSSQLNYVDQSSVNLVTSKLEKESENMMNKLKGKYGVYRSTNIDMYRYASNNPLTIRDSDGRADFFLGVSGEACFGGGGTGGYGIVADTTDVGNSGFYVSGGVAAGFNQGFSINVGATFRSIEGTGVSTDFNLGSISVSLLADNKGFNGVAIGPGVGAGISITGTKTDVLSAKKVASTLLNFVQEVSGYNEFMSSATK